MIGWELCPWAARAWHDGQVVRRVFMRRRARRRRATWSPSLTSWPRKQDAAIGLAMFPRVARHVGAWESFAERVRRAAARLPGSPRFIPTTAPPRPASADPARLVPFIRRTPDPTLQFVRASLLDDLARDGRDLSADIARDNHETVTARGPAALDALLADLRRDRDAAYARLAPGWLTHRDARDGADLRLGRQLLERQHRQSGVLDLDQAADVAADLDAGQQHRARGAGGTDGAPDGGDDVARDLRLQRQVAAGRGLLDRFADRRPRSSGRAGSAASTPASPACL